MASKAVQWAGQSGSISTLSGSASVVMAGTAKGKEFASIYIAPTVRNLTTFTLEVKWDNNAAWVTIKAADWDTKDDVLVQTSGAALETLAANSTGWVVVRLPAAAEYRFRATGSTDNTGLLAFQGGAY